jgi:UDP-GlcNAc:undecaprenyl-phosphate GlcNAc-1-phosphate transferase
VKGLTASFIVALAVAWVVTPFVLHLAWKKGVLAHPRDRDVHTEPTPRWGGIAIYLGVMIAVVFTVSARHLITGGEAGWTWQLAGILLAGTAMAAIGLVDDVKDLRALFQIFGIVCAGVILIAFGVRIEGLTIPFEQVKPGSWAGINLAFWPSVLITLFWVFVVTKTVDAIDGLDGLAAGVCAISAATLGLMAAASNQPGGPSIALLAAAVAGACIGFLRYNFNPAKIFMSTVGAQFLGLMLAAISIVGTFKVAAAISVAVPVLVLGVPIFDYGIVIMRRLANKAPLTKADRRHLHHRLLDRGLSQRQAVWVIYGCTIVLCGAALAIFQMSR